MKQIDFINESKHRIDDVLQAFKIGHEGITASSGPTVTLFEFRPKVGIRISKIVNLKNEFAIALGVQGVRIIAPTERGTVGIEVPNKQRVTIPMADMLYSEEYQNTDMELPLCIGRKVDCNVFMVDLAEMPHLLVAGATGMGKSVGLNAIITSLINKKSPDELKLVLIDPKQVELTVYEKIAKPYLLKLTETDNAIITDTDKAMNMLNAVCRVMDERYLKLKDMNVRNINEYNAIAIEKMPYYVVIIDEYGDLIMQSEGTAMEKAICRIAQKARAVGIHMIISTQRPSTDIVTGRIKANFPTRIAFRTVTGTDSRVILDRIGAEKLAGRGDMLFYNGGDTIRCQCAYVSTDEVLTMCAEIDEEFGECEQSTLTNYVTVIKPQPSLNSMVCTNKNGQIELRTAYGLKFVI
jgi:S-DNA-T family DNA segregation ATPase FtsK/SpoIIIE